jgi:hypothetical protein
MSEKIIAYKGFNTALQCRDFQFEIGKEYAHEGPVKVCNSGFHACEYPLEVFDYYAPANSRFVVVEQSGDISRGDSDTKAASRSIELNFEIGIPGLVKAAVEYTFKRALPVDPLSAASAPGDQGAASATGTQGAASATGYQGAASAPGDQGAASAMGYQGAASATGMRGVAISGWDGKAKAGVNGAIVLIRRDNDRNVSLIRSSKVGENGIQPDVWYTLDDNGEFIEGED